MADYELMKFFRDNAVTVPQMDAKRLSRSELGTLGMPQIIEQLKEIRRQFETFTPYAETAGNSLLREAKNRYQTYFQFINQIGDMPVGEFSSNHLDLEKRLDEEWGRIMEIWPPACSNCARQKGSSLRPEHPASRT